MMNICEKWISKTLKIVLIVIFHSLFKSFFRF